MIGLSAFRCRVMAMTYPVAFVVGWLMTSAVREIVERPRPTAFGDFESFPSGHLVQATFVAGLVPLAVGVLLLDRRVGNIVESGVGGGRRRNGSTPCAPSAPLALWIRWPGSRSA